MKKIAMSLALVPAVFLGACATTPDGPPKLTERQSERLEKLIAGKVAGEPVSCVGRVGSSNRLEVISDGLIVYRASSDLVYVNDLIGSCHGISTGDTLLLKPALSQYCSGDIARSVDLMSGIAGGSCALGQFVPYRTPAGG